MAQNAKITVHPSYTIGEISERLFSAFLEPIGTMVNGTMYNPKHPTADEQGFRKDFIDALKATRLPAVRLPGGNFVSAWQWKNSIGPAENRRACLDPAWHQYYTNQVGHDEYLQWAAKVGTEPLYTVNMGTGTIQDAMDLVEYTNHIGGTYWSDLRRSYGHEEPYNVKMWYLGNEMDGPWQLGAWDKNPEGYGHKVLETSKAIKWIDEKIETAVCGSSAPFMEGFPAWDEAVLDKCYDVVDYVSVHHYHSAAPGNIKGLLGGSLYYEDFINTEIAMIDYVASKHRSPKKVNISFDEYEAMVRPLQQLHPGYGRYNMARNHYHFDPSRNYIRHDPDNMPERQFPGGDMLPALSMASIQLALLRHADRVKIGCMTGGLNALAASNHDHVWKNASHHVYSSLLAYAKGISLDTKVECETYDMPGYAIEDTSQYTGKEGVNYIDSASAWDQNNNRLTIFVINRNEDSEYPLTIDLMGFDGYNPAIAYKMHTDDLEIKNSFDNEDALIPMKEDNYTFENGIFKVYVKPLSWNVYVFEKKSFS
ncbi:alpha-L-arabinofuranosidase C-terminal domain-containing protein [Butyrivibrio sp. YAB3001]|uniref:alpha-L-arabinofuranosidase C-terminal domain-containing protein n=1 Tax=Butyrivibrio sp. YAB3001 TaxID=1520812 RepID=UPI0008F66B66|nr:alpha-L-arabinofuranosidase C-terminal domain-containing protein [Butyrivibrio sp. YAB3001]SFD06193.1 alpha-N-arabinofuranosidase [Butyrivibrio sp. YAB3001]